MNQIPLYQHPHVEVFKAFKLLEWKLGHKEGAGVDEEFDKQLGKTVLKLEAANSTSTYFQLPAQKLLPKKALGLTGKYVFIQIQAIQGKNFVIHLDYTINDSRNVRVSLSNIYKEFKNLNGNSIQIPLNNLEPEKWSVVMLSPQELFLKNKIFSEGQQPKAVLRSLQVQACLKIKQIITSDLKYNASNMPKDIQFRLPKDRDWHATYQWLEFPEGMPEDQQLLSAQSSERVVSQRSAISKGSNVGKKKVQFGKENTEENIKKKEEEQKIENIRQQRKQMAETIVANEKKAQEIAIEKTIKEMEAIKEQNKMTFLGKAFEPEAEVTVYTAKEQKPFNPRLPNAENFILKPDPIMRLERISGCHPLFQSGKVYFSKDEKRSKEVLYTQADMILGYYEPTQKQRVFCDEKRKETIDQFYLFSQLAVTTQRVSPKEVEVSLWDVENCDKITAFRPPLSSLLCVSLSSDRELLCLAGKDHQKRDLILIYKIQDLTVLNKVDIYVRCLSDFDIQDVRFNDIIPNTLISVGRENIRILKIKTQNGSPLLSAQNIALNNQGRGKTFNLSLIDFEESEKGVKKPVSIFASTTDGLLYQVNFNSRQTEKVIQIHDSEITQMLLFPSRRYLVTTSLEGILRIWTPDFQQLISEINTHTPITDCDVNLHETEIVLMTKQAQIGIIDLENCSYETYMRSHQDEILDVCFNSVCSKLVTASKDGSIKIWNSTNLQQVFEFESQNDYPCKLATSMSDPVVAVGYKSGFVRIFDLHKFELYFETMTGTSEVKDLQFSPDSRILATIDRDSRILLISVENKLAVKNIDFNCPSDQFSLAFSPDSTMLANISTNGNMITIWETQNFSLRYPPIDLTGQHLQKLEFAPNGKDLLVLTSAAKLIYLRLPVKVTDPVMTVREHFGLTEMQCLDFKISPNNQFIFAVGKEGTVKVYDYFMRGSVVSACQAFKGHLKHASKLVFDRDLEFIFTVGPQNGIFKWRFQGDGSMPQDITQVFEEVTHRTKTLKEEAQEADAPTQKLLDYTRQQIEELQGRSIAIAEARFDLERDLPDDIRPGSYNFQPHEMDLRVTKMSAGLDINMGGYQSEKFQIELKKTLSISTDNVRHNLVWNPVQKYMAYTSENIVVVEALNQEKTQKLLKEGNDKIHQLILSPNRKLLLGFTRFGHIDGHPCIFIWDALTHKKLNQIAIADNQIQTVQFSPFSNMLLVVSNDSQSEEDEQCRSTVAIWDFLEGCKDVFCKSIIPKKVLAAKWNPFTPTDISEFVTLSAKSYTYWRVTNQLKLEYQEGHMQGESGGEFRSVEFLVPSPVSVSTYLALGRSDGWVWVADVRTNQHLSSTKALEQSVDWLGAERDKLVLASHDSTKMSLYPQSAQSLADPAFLFAEPEQQLSFDGRPVAVSCDPATTEFLLSTTAGTLWLGSWAEGATVKVKACHAPHQPINLAEFKYLPPSHFQVEAQTDEFQFDQNYLVASSGQDGVIKLWSMFDLDFKLQFLVPKEQCVAVALHQFKPFLFASFTDGFVRVFDTEQGRALGRIDMGSATGVAPSLEQKPDQQNQDYIVAMTILPSGNHILAASRNGLVSLISVQSWNPLGVLIHALACLNTQIVSLEASFLEPYGKWLVGTGNGKLVVYNRKEALGFQQDPFDTIPTHSSAGTPPSFIFMDQFNLLDFVSNGFTEAKRAMTLDHYYNTSQERKVLFNSITQENACVGVFARNDLNVHICFIRQCNKIFLRNFMLHQVIKQIELSALPRQLEFSPTSHFFFVLQSDSKVKMIDSVNEQNTSEVQTIHQEAKQMRICPNGKYLITGGSKGDICLWSIRRE